MDIKKDVVYVVLHRKKEEYKTTGNEGHSQGRRKGVEEMAVEIEK